MSRFRTLLAIAALVGAGTTAQAATISFGLPGTDINTGLLTTNFNTTIALPKFNSTLGTLTSITFTLAGTVISQISFESLDAAPSIVTGTAAATITLTRPDASTLVHEAVELLRSAELILRQIRTRMIWEKVWHEWQRRSI